MPEPGGTGGNFGNPTSERGGNPRDETAGFPGGTAFGNRAPDGGEGRLHPSAGPGTAGLRGAPNFTSSPEFQAMFDSIRAGREASLLAAGAGGQALNTPFAPLNIGAPPAANVQPTAPILGQSNPQLAAFLQALLGQGAGAGGVGGVQPTQPGPFRNVQPVGGVTPLQPLGASSPIDFGQLVAGG